MRVFDYFISYIFLSVAVVDTYEDVQILVLLAWFYIPVLLSDAKRDSTAESTCYTIPFY